MRIAVLVSGGVDSSVALGLLKEQGHDIVAVYLKIWLDSETDFLGECPWEEDLKYVHAVCEQANVPMEVIPLQREYFDEVVSYTIDEIKAGRTPNPDMLCNRSIKFGLAVKKIDEKFSGKFDKIASGHYAQIEEQNGIYYLKKSPDQVKDQTYFLGHLSQKQLARIMFPIGHLTKVEVRALAAKLNLPNRNRKDSQGICFLGKLKFNEFVEHYLGTKPGDLIEYETGAKIGEHKGYFYHTIGQRKGIGLAGGPWYVVEKDIGQNIVYVSKNYHDPKKKRNSFVPTEFNWFEGKAPRQRNLTVKLRHGENEYDCTFSSKKVIIRGQDQGIAAGQFAVFYDQDRCLGCAKIS